jgi:serine/threonine protein kinase
MPDSTTNPDILKGSFPQFSGFELIGQGGYKYVFKIRLQDGSQEVLKIIRVPAVPTGLAKAAEEDATAIREQELARAKREIEALKKCASPFVVKLGSMQPVITSIAGIDCVVYTEEILSGRNLYDVIASGVKPTEADVRSLMLCVLRAINSLWNEQRIVHRDIKPGNIMKTGLQDRPYVLLDLGIAYDVSQPGLTVRRDLDPPMTYRYMAPEMADLNFRENLDYRSDLYALALTGFEYSAGQHPIARDTDDKLRTVSRALHQEPKRLHDLRNDFSQDFCRVIDQLLKKKPMLRPGNLSQLMKSMETSI